MFSRLLSLAAVIVLSNTSTAQIFDGSTYWLTNDFYRSGAMFFGDANADGIPDLVSANYEAGSYPPMDFNDTIFFGSSEGLSANPNWVSEEANECTAGGWILFPQQEYPSLITINGSTYARPVSLYKNSTGNLLDTPDWQADFLPIFGIAYAHADLNMDGYPDIFISGQSPYEPVPNFGFLSNADGSFDNNPNWLSSNTGQFGGVIIADFDGSGATEAIETYTGNGQQRMFWLPNTPLLKINRVLVDNGNPGLITTNTVYGYIIFTKAPAEGSTIEIMYEYSTENELLISHQHHGINFYRFNGTSMETEPYQNMAYNYGFRELAVADINKDGNYELIGGGYSNYPLAIFDVAGGHLDEPIWQDASSDIAVQEMDISDINHDGFPDIAITRFCQPDAEVHIYINNNGSFSREPDFTIDRGSNPGCATALALEDLTGNGMPDLVVGWSSSSIEAYTNTFTPPPAPHIDDMTIENNTLIITGSNFGDITTVYIDNHFITDIAELHSNGIVVGLESTDINGSQVSVINGDLQAAVKTYTNDGCSCNNHSTPPILWTFILLFGFILSKINMVYFKNRD